MLRAAIAALFAAAVAAAPAVAGPGFFVGAGEDHAATLTRAVPTATDLGLGAFRVPIQWHVGQSRLDEEQAAGLAQLVATAPPSIRIVPTSWSLGGETPLDDAARNDYCSFTRDILARFPRINDVIIWNEPNKEMFWQPQYHPDETSAAPAAYVALLARCYDVLHAFRPSVNVIAPATSPRGNDRPNAVSNISHSPLTFISQMGAAYRASGRTARIFDTVAHHAYGSSSRERPWRTHPTTQISEGDWSKLMIALSSAFNGTGQDLPGRVRPRALRLDLVHGGRLPDGRRRGQGGALLERGGRRHAPRLHRRRARLASARRDAPRARPPHAGRRRRPARGVPALRPGVLQLPRRRQPVARPLAVRASSGPTGRPRTRIPHAKAVIAEARSGRVDCDALKSGPSPVIDARAPAPPSRPALKPARRSVALNWPDARDNDVMGFAVFRSSKARGPFTRLKATLTPASAFVDRGLRPGRRYCYAVVAVDTSENRSRRSASRCVSTKR